MNFEEPLIKTKLYIPQRQAHWVPRPRLISRLEDGNQRSLVIISAPIGFGKTSLLSDWITSSETQLPIAWLTLDERDNDPIRFGRYLAAALETINIQVEIQNLLSGQADVTALESVLTGLINQSAEFSGNFALVLDDYHLVENPIIHKALAYILTCLPQQMHLVIATRCDPPLPISQMRARGQIVEIRTQDMRFTFDEIHFFLHQNGQDQLSEDAIDLLDANIEGWPAGWQLAALSMQACKDPALFIRNFTGSHRYIVDYLGEQILHQQPEHIQDFLMITSVLEQLCSPLCKTLIDSLPLREDSTEGSPASTSRSSQAVLEHLERSNLFLVALDDDRQWYRYHNLFGDFLRQRFQQTHPKQWLEAHHLAADWYESNGHYTEAVDHALAVGDAAQAVKLIELIAERIWSSGDVTRLFRWLQTLPEDMVSSRPRLCIFHAWISNIMGNFKLVENRLKDVERYLNQCADTNSPGMRRSEELDTIQGMYATTQAIIAIMEGDITRTNWLCQQALSFLPESNLAWRCVVLRNQGSMHILAGQTQQAMQVFRQAYQLSLRADNIYMALICLYEMAELLILQGKLCEAEQICCQGLKLAQEKGALSLSLIGALHLALAEVLRQWNQLTEARRHAQRGVELGERACSLGVRVCGYIRLGMISHALGDSAAEMQAFQHAEQLAPSRRQSSFLAHYDLQARLWERCAEGLPLSLNREIEEWYTSPDPEAALVGTLNEAHQISYARLLLKRHSESIRTSSNGKDVQQVALLLEKLLHQASSAGRCGRQIEILALLALAQFQRGKNAQAVNTMEQALTLGEPEGYVRVFADEGKVMRDLLQEYKCKHITKHLGYVEKILEALKVKPQSKPQRVYPAGPEILAIRGGGAGVVETEALETDPNEPLSDREIQILRLISAGLTNKEAAAELFLANSTVQWYTKSIYRKLNVNSRTQAGLRARELGILNY